MQPLPVRAGKGTKDRCPTVPATRTPVLQNHPAGVKTWHGQESAQGPVEVSLPPALARKSPPAAQAWGSPSVFPARNTSVAPRAGVTRRHHGAPSVITKAIKVAVRRAGLMKPIIAHTLHHAFATHRLPRGTDIRHQIPQAFTRLITGAQVMHIAKSTLDQVGVGTIAWQKSEEGFSLVR
jgi:integrase